MRGPAAHASNPTSEENEATTHLKHLRVRNIITGTVGIDHRDVPPKTHSSSLTHTHADMQTHVLTDIILRKHTNKYSRRTRGPAGYKLSGRIINTAHRNLAHAHTRHRAHAAYI
jgi:hypothetical protein